MALYVNLNKHFLHPEPKASKLLTRKITMRVPTTHATSNPIGDLLTSVSDVDEILTNLAASHYTSTNQVREYSSGGVVWYANRYVSHLLREYSFNLLVVDR